MSCYFKEEPCLFDTWPYPRKGFPVWELIFAVGIGKAFTWLQVFCLFVWSVVPCCQIKSAHCCLLSSLWKEMWLCLNRCKQRDDIVVLGALGFSGLQNWISTSPFHALSSTITSSFYLAPHVSPSYRIPPSVRLLPVTPYRRRMRRRAAASAALKEHKRLLSAIFYLSYV